MYLGVSNTVVARNGLGRFIKECEQAAENSVQDLIEEGARTSREIAPVGKKDDPRSPHIKDSITSYMLSRTSGVWVCSARHALAVELGTVRHFQTGDVGFFWDNADRWWSPGENMIDHPATAARPYLKPAYDKVVGDSTETLRRNYPG